MIAKLKERWITWRTGKDKIVRDWEKWRSENIITNAHTVQNYFMHFKHIIEVDRQKFWDFADPFGWVPVEDFQQYEYPRRPLGDNAVGNWFRGYWDQYDKRFHLCDMSGTDHVFVATNNDEDAVMIALKYS